MIPPEEPRSEASEDPDEAAVLAYFEQLSNRGRWGVSDERGTLNLITPQKILEAAREVQVGLTVGCARRVVREPPTPDVAHPPVHYMLKSGESAVRPVDDGDMRQTSASDFIGVVSHGFTVTHIDALSHIFWDDYLYNGFRRELVTTAAGATVCSVETMKDGIVTRGVLIDVAGHRGIPYLEPGDAIRPAEIEEIERVSGVRCSEGDALVVRTGWPARRGRLGVDPQRHRDRPGLHASCLPWLSERGVALVAVDSATDVEPSGYAQIRMPVHAVGSVAMGLCIVDNCDFDDLAEAAARYSRPTFMLTLAPLRFAGATGSPITPVAVF